MPFILKNLPDVSNSAKVNGRLPLIHFLLFLYPSLILPKVGKPLAIYFILILSLIT